MPHWVPYVLISALLLGPTAGLAENDPRQKMDKTSNRSVIGLLSTLEDAGYQLEVNQRLSDRVISLFLKKKSKERHEGLLGGTDWDRIDNIEFRLVSIENDQYLIADIKRTSQLKAPLGKWRDVESDYEGISVPKIGEIFSGPLKSR